MSDFDKEAEREKLREQLEREEESREATQHMSELLLKGATMTNKHCDDCSDPIFRYQGQEFCPTCGEAVGTQDDAGQPEQEGAEAAGSDAGEAAGSATIAGTDREAVDERRTEQQSPAQPSGDVEAGGQPSRRSTATGGAQAATEDGDLDEARAALARKLTRLARQAEETDDAGRSRDLLGAAREAAEALAAVDRARR